MNFDAESHLNAMDRSVSFLERDGMPASAVTLARSYATAIEDLWDAVTNSERIPRWFTGISGELDLGGRYQLEGNAGGAITACEALSHYELTWEFAGDVSWVEVRLTDDGAAGIRVALTHTAHLSDHTGTHTDRARSASAGRWDSSASRSISRDRMSQDRTKWRLPPHRTARRSSRAAAKGWAHAAIAAGTDPEIASAAAKRTTAFYTGESADLE